MYGRWLCKRWCPILEADDEQSLQQFKQHEYSCWSSFTNIFLFAYSSFFEYSFEQNNKILFPWKNCANMSVAVVIPWKCFLKPNNTIWDMFLSRAKKTTRKHIFNFSCEVKRTSQKLDFGDEKKQTAVYHTSFWQDKRSEANITDSLLPKRGNLWIFSSGQNLFVSLG